MLLKKFVAVMLWVALSTLSSLSVADELVKQIQQDLTVLGYDAGTADGQMGVKTQMAIGKFQKNYGLPVDGKPSVSVAIAISEAKEATQKTTTHQVTSTTPSVAEQEACLKQKAEQAQAQQSKSSMFGALTDMAGTVLSSFGQHELVTMLGQAKTVAQQAETVSQLSKDLGISEQQVSDCLATAQ